MKFTENKYLYDFKSQNWVRIAQGAAIIGGDLQSTITQSDQPIFYVVVFCFVFFIISCLKAYFQWSFGSKKVEQAVRPQKPTMSGFVPLLQAVCIKKTKTYM